MVADIEVIKKSLALDTCKYCRLTDSKGVSLITWNKKGNYSSNSKKILKALVNSELPSGLYYIQGKTYYAGADLFNHCYQIGTDIKPLEEMTKEEEVSIKVEIERLKAENEALKRELEADAEDEEELTEAPAANYSPLAEKLITTLSEVAVPLINRYFEQRERQITALEAAASTATRPAAIAPAPSFQVSRSYTPKAPSPAQQVPPAAAPAPTVIVTGGSAGGGGIAPQDKPKIPDDITEEEYLEAVKHLTMEELIQYYNQIRKSGNKIEMQFFLAVVKEVRPDDLLTLIDNESGS